MECIDCIPSNVTPAVNEIVLTDFNSSHFVPHMFCGVSWPRVVNLTIVNENSVKIDEAFGIGNLTFDCLHEIETLKLDFQVLKNLSRNALYGLDNVIILDFTHCIHLEVPELTIALSLDTNIPKLQRLILNNLGTAVDGIQLSQEFIDKLAHRKIQSLDMSSTTVGFVNPSVNVDKICDSLKTFNLANSLILHSHFENVSPCYSLRVLNLSGAKLPRFPFPSGNITIPPPVPPVFQVSPLWYTFFSTVSVIYLNNIISPDHYIFLNNATLSIQVENSLTEIHLSGYSIPVCELKFKIDPNHVKYLDISNNKIERLSSDSLAYLEHLERIDLSNNRLSVSEQFDNTLSFIFRNNSKLEITELSHNGLTNLPSDMFKLNTELKRIDLSNNEVTQIPFEISHLYSLELLDLRENAVEYLNVWTRHQIDILYKNKQSKTEIKPFTVDLRDNPFSCKCHSLDFIKWFVQSPVFDDTRDFYHCEINRKLLPMNTDAIEAGQYDCEKPQREARRLLIIVLVPCVSVVMTIVLFKRYKRQKLLLRIREQINLIHEDQSDYKFPVFLSYSSEDSSIVCRSRTRPIGMHRCFYTSQPTSWNVQF